MSFPCSATGIAAQFAAPILSIRMLSKLSRYEYMWLSKLSRYEYMWLSKLSRYNALPRGKFQARGEFGVRPVTHHSSAPPCVSAHTTVCVHMGKHTP